MAEMTEAGKAALALEMFVALLVRANNLRAESMAWVQRALVRDKPPAGWLFEPTNWRARVLAAAEMAAALEFVEFVLNGVDVSEACAAHLDQAADWLIEWQNQLAAAPAAVLAPLERGHLEPAPAGSDSPQVTYPVNITVQLDSHTEPVDITTTGGVAHAYPQPDGSTVIVAHIT